MSSILSEIVQTKIREVAAAKSRLPQIELEQLCRAAGPTLDFTGRLKDSPPIRLIAEVKKASPSKGLIRPDFNPFALATAYQKAGASCLSVLTDEPYFQGSLKYLEQIRKAVDLPLLRKDFIIDEYQLFEARHAGADAVLLIAECLDRAQLLDLYQAARSLSLHVLIELYDVANLDNVLATGCPLVGVNNRDLHSFEVDLQHVIRLRKQIPEDRVLVGESGIFTREDALMLQSNGIQAMLVGESLMRQADVELATRRLLGTAI